MSLASPTPEPENKRILKWSNFYNPDSTKHLSMEQSFQLQKVLMDARKPFAQAEELASTETSRQIAKDLYDFTTELVSALFIQHKGEVKLLSQMTKDAMNDSMTAALDLHKELNDTENNGE